MINRTDGIMEHLLDRDPSIVFISETWLKSDTNNVTSLVMDYGYKLLHRRRKYREKDLGGGVVVLLKQSLDYKYIKYKHYSSFELDEPKICFANKKSLTLVSIYRVLFISTTVFLYEIIQLFEILISSNENIILAGDVNVHMDENFPTHIWSHLGHSYISKIKSSEYDISHHFLVEFDVAVTPNKKEYKTIVQKLKVY